MEYDLHLHWLDVAVKRVLLYNDKAKRKPLLSLAVTEKVNVYDPSFGIREKLTSEDLITGIPFAIVLNIVKEVPKTGADIFQTMLDVLQSLGYRPGGPCESDSLASGSQRAQVELMKLIEWAVVDRTISIEHVVSDLKRLPRSFFVLSERPSVLDDAISLWLSKFPCSHTLPEIKDLPNEIAQGQHMAFALSRVYPKRIPKDEINVGPELTEMMVEHNWERATPVLEELMAFIPMPRKIECEHLMRLFFADVFYATRAGAKKFVRMDPPPPPAPTGASAQPARSKPKPKARPATAKPATARPVTAPQVSVDPSMPRKTESAIKRSPGARMERQPAPPPEPKKEAPPPKKRRRKTKERKDVPPAETPAETPVPELEAVEAENDTPVVVEDVVVNDTVDQSVAESNTGAQSDNVQGGDLRSDDTQGDGGQEGNGQSGDGQGDNGPGDNGHGDNVHGGNGHGDNGHGDNGPGGNGQGDNGHGDNGPGGNGQGGNEQGGGEIVGSRSDVRTDGEGTNRPEETKGVSSHSHRSRGFAKTMGRRRRRSRSPRRSRHGTDYDYDYSDGYDDGYDEDEHFRSRTIPRRRRDSGVRRRPRRRAHSENSSDDEVGHRSNRHTPSSTMPLFGLEKFAKEAERFGLAAQQFSREANRLSVPQTQPIRLRELNTETLALCMQKCEVDENGISSADLEKMKYALEEFSRCKKEDQTLNHLYEVLKRQYDDSVPEEHVQRVYERLVGLLRKVAVDPSSLPHLLLDIAKSIFDLTPKTELLDPSETIGDKVSDSEAAATEEGERQGEHDDNDETQKDGDDTQKDGDGDEDDTRKDGDEDDIQKDGDEEDTQKDDADESNRQKTGEEEDEDEDTQIIVGEPRDVVDQTDRLTGSFVDTLHQETQTDQGVQGIDEDFNTLTERPPREMAFVEPSLLFERADVKLADDTETLESVDCDISVRHVPFRRFTSFKRVAPTLRTAVVVPNSKIITLLIRFTAMPAPQFDVTRTRLLQFLEGFKDDRIFVLMTNMGLKMKAMYRMAQRTDHTVTKIWGNGPAQISERDVGIFWKYGSAAKRLEPIPTKHFTQTTDALCIKRSLEPRGW